MSHRFVLDFGIADYDAAVAEMDKQDDRGLVIVATSLCEAFLVRAIKSRFVHDDAKIEGQFMKGYGPLGSFRSRIDMGFFLGLYDIDCHKRLLRVKNIRNQMAHTIKPLTFSTQDIRDQMDYLPKFPSIIAPWQKMKDQLDQNLPFTSMPRERADKTLSVITDIVKTFEEMQQGDRHRFMAYIQNRTVSLILAEAAGIASTTPSAYLVHL